MEFFKCKIRYIFAQKNVALCYITLKINKIFAKTIYVTFYVNKHFLVNKNFYVQLIIHLFSKSNFLIVSLIESKK